MSELLVVGDVHGMWDAVDETFVEGGQQDAVLFVGDFGDEDVPLVQRVARLRCCKKVILGNHDGWYGMRRGGDFGKVRAQLAALGDDHLGYGAWAAPGGYGVVGARPFSWGGGWRTWVRFYEPLYGITTNDQSADRIVAAAATLGERPLLVLGHNGPRGLGVGRDAIYGCDFRQPHIDFGDPDLQLALNRLGDRPVLATVAGHMHSLLVGGGLRRRLVRTGSTVHVNAAVVPRHVTVAGRRRRHYLRLRVDLEQRVSATDLWVDDGGQVVSECPVAENAASPSLAPG